MFTVNGNGTYGVRFFVNGKAEYVTVDSELPDVSWTHGNGSHLDFANGSLMWAPLAEKAFVELNAEPGVTQQTTGNSYINIEGGNAFPISLLTGKSNPAYYGYNYYGSESAWASNVQSLAANAVSAGEEVLIGTGDTVSDYSRFVQNHMFEVLGYDAASGLFTLHNPWGSGYVAGSSTQTTTTFAASMSDLYTNNCGFYIASGKSLA